MGQLQSFLRRSLSTRNYVLLFGVGLLVAVGVTILIAFVRIRERRLQRFALLLVALVFGSAYMWWTATPWAEVNAVERVHFAEYGLIAFLFYRASLPRRSVGEGGRHAGDLSIVILPLLAGFAVGTFDEWLQWFIPYPRRRSARRVHQSGRARLRAVVRRGTSAAGQHFRARLQPASWRRLGVTLAIVLVDFRGVRQPGASRAHGRTSRTSGVSSRITPQTN